MMTKTTFGILFI